MEHLIRITKKVEELERKQLEVRRNLKKCRELKRGWEKVVAMRRQREIDEMAEKKKPAVAFNSNPFAICTDIKPLPFTGFVWPSAVNKSSFEKYHAAFARIEDEIQPEAKRQRTD